MNVQEIKLPSNGILQFDVPSHLFEKVKQKIEILKNTKLEDENLYNNKFLAGQIEKELRFYPDMEFRTWLNSIAKSYNEYFDTGDQIELDKVWVNFQKKHEYNPVHDHTGNLSFVIWVKVPYSLENEDNMPNTILSGKGVNGRFCFIYNTNFSGSSNFYFDVDSTYEAKGIIFPANAKHCVYPFYTSDEYRISIAGNFIKL